MAEAKLKIVDDRTIILELLRTYNGESFVYEHNNSSERRQGYHLNDKPGLTTFDILNGIRIPIKDIGALVIKLGTMEERLEIDFRAKADYFWINKNLEGLDGLYVANAAGVYANHQSANISITDTERLRTDPNPAMNTFIAYKKGELIGQYTEFIMNVLNDVIPLNIGPYRLHRVPDKKKTEDKI
ncbi:hypothetical protein HN695_03570 [Candidatus Woesearchaeota archaeon]|jgi:hypothetical protein|nr:hypothetical protein [Candidatus Woesearchaeota archaeon]MBT5272229.1 hypothetical protein [Candidatus Woesearchaeota archaeon]MBT6040525.1 hypothetical protein [Candidatus Woesearchaeota archaeon]MBT6336501.1 hypothetical protein [Candidatus Woesearchaeota archaeon]MBT7927391.1 hypothetical protein [Candidatus Woesearchaeota archaeon]